MKTTTDEKGFIQYTSGRNPAVRLLPLETETDGTSRKAVAINFNVRFYITPWRARGADRVRIFLLGGVRRGRRRHDDDATRDAEGRRRGCVSLKSRGGCDEEGGAQGSHARGACFEKWDGKQLLT